MKFCMRHQKNGSQKLFGLDGESLKSLAEDDHPLKSSFNTLLLQKLEFVHSDFKILDFNLHTFRLCT